MLLSLGRHWIFVLHKLAANHLAAERGYYFMPQLWKVPNQIRRIIGAAHGLSGWLIGRTAFRLYGENCLKLTDEQPKEVARRFPDAELMEEKALALLGSESLFMVWLGYRDAVRLQSIPGMGDRWNISDIAKRLRSTPPHRRKNTVEFLKMEVADMVKDERRLRKKPGAESLDLDRQIERVVAAAHRIEEWLKEHHGSCPSPDVSEKRALAALLEYESYIIWTGYRDAVRMERFRPVLKIEAEMASVSKAFLRARRAIGKEKHLQTLLALAGRLKRAERECAALFPKGMTEEWKKLPPMPRAKGKR